MSNNDNAMTRFLFAILKQKNLKDIDWNKVAHDPILAQEITNGHAARMRYSRFKSAMLGLEPKTRNRNNKDKKVTKVKKELKGSRRGNSEDLSGVKGESDIDSDRVKPDPEAMRIKQEAAATATAVTATAASGGGHAHSYTQIQYESQFMPNPDAGTQHSQHKHQYQHSHELHPRLLTPSSDTDILHAHTQLSATGAGSPESLISVATGFDLGSAATVAACGHDQTSSWQMAGPGGYSTNFDAAFYPPPSSGSSCEHQHQHQHQHSHDDLMMSGHHTPIKHENWESHFPPV